MLYNNDVPFSFHIELTDKCNARCPQCSRNIINKDTKELTERKLDNGFSEIYLEDFKKIFEGFDYTIRKFNFCGNYGDPFFARDIYEITEWVGTELTNPETFGFIELHTNGGFRSPKWWASYGKMMSELFPKKHRVVFSIDGLEDTHHIYRVNTRYDRVVENARAFIDAGGSAEWSFIKFGHNQHQLEEAKRRAKEYGFESFIPVNTQRFFGKDSVSFNFKGKEYEITVATDKMSQERHQKSKKWAEVTRVEETRKVAKQSLAAKEPVIPQVKSNINCVVKKRNELFIDCAGDIHPCCWIGSWEYRRRRHYIRPNDEHEHPIFDMRELRNAIDEPLTEIIHDDFFDYILPESFKHSPCNICIKQCSKADVRTIKIREDI